MNKVGFVLYNSNMCVELCKGQVYDEPNFNLFSFAQKYFQQEFVHPTCGPA